MSTTCPHYVGCPHDIDEAEFSASAGPNTDPDRPCPCGAGHTYGEHGYGPAEADADDLAGILDDHRSGAHRAEAHGGCPLCETAEQADALRNAEAAAHDRARNPLEATDRCPECGQDFTGRYCEDCAIVSSSADQVHELIGDDIDTMSDRMDAVASLLGTAHLRPDLVERIAQAAGLLEG